MGKKLIITENEKNRILDLYGILRKSLNEATPTTPTKTTTTTTTTLKPVKIKTIFQSGCHSNEGGQSCTPNQLTNIFAPYMEQIKAFLKAAPTNQIVEVVLSASESKVPNRNAELPKVKQKDGTLRHPKLQPKVLSQYRYESIEAYLKSVFEKMVSEKVITKIPEFVKSDVVIGGPAWDTKKGSKHPDYTKHQYLMAVIRLKEVSASETVTKCMTNMEIQINYTDLSKTHTCNNAIYTIFANGIKLFRDDGKDYASLANANGPYDDKPDTCAKLPGRVKGKNPGNPEFLAPNKEKDKACARYNRFIINAELAAEILAKTENPNSPQIKLEATCLDDGWYNTNTYKWTGGCHEGAGNIVIINGNGERFDYSSATPNEFGTSKVLAILDPCGNKIS